jgi:hypothetical protein
MTGSSNPANNVAPQKPVAATPAGQPLYTAAFGTGSVTNPLDFSALSAAAIGGNAAARKTLVAQGYKLIPNPSGGALQPYAVVPA